MTAVDSLNPYSKGQKAKELTLIPELQRLTEYHRHHCEAYRRLLYYFYRNETVFPTSSTIPYLPVTLFKTQKLLSIPESQIYKVLQSSGTTGMQPSRIFLDQVTSQRQTMALAAIMTSFLGPKRLPMLVLDHPNVIHDRHSYNARGAALVGMLSFGRDVCYAFDEAMTFHFDRVHQWLQKYQEQPMLLFGLTFVVWQYWLSKLKEGEFFIPQGILMHTGGWKKIEVAAVSPEMFRERLYSTTGIRRCHNFYGMVEQVGSVFVACEWGNFHCPEFAEVIIRSPDDWQEAPYHTPGVVQVLSTLPTSYPGHSLLTEDLGVLLGCDDCPCGRHGKYFHIQGRVPQAEVRGCGDTFILGGS